MRKNSCSLKIFVFAVLCAAGLFVAFTIFVNLRNVSPASVSEAYVQGYETLLQSELGRLASADSLVKAELYGTYKDKSLYAQNIRLVLKNPETGEVLSEINPPQNSGINPSFILANFTEKRTQQIFLGINSGGSGGYGYFYVYDFTNNKLKTIFDFDKTDLNFTARYENGYKIRVENTNSGNIYSADLSYKGKEYLDKLYNADGTLKIPADAQVYPVTAVFPYYNSSLLKYQLEIISPVSGLCHADGIGDVITLQNYVDGAFKTYYEIFGVNS